jgi:secreted trypsin-like serine protease
MSNGPSNLLTAAHCFDNESYTNMTVVFGEHDVGRRESGEQRRAIALVFPHDDYDGAMYTNDIALVELRSPVELTDTVQTIETRPIVELPKQVQAAGWGKTSDGTLSRTLQEITLDVLPPDACVDSKIGPNEFCAGSWGLGEAQDTCGGDSGGPVFFREPGSAPVLVGITSRGLDYCDGRGVYTSVDAYYGWFRMSLGQHSLGINLPSAAIGVAYRYPCQWALCTALSQFLPSNPRSSNLSASTPSKQRTLTSTLSGSDRGV